MKWFTFILSFYVFILASAPSLEMLGVSVVCCQGKEVEKESNKSANTECEATCDDICNPFITCHCCFSLVASADYQLGKASPNLDTSYTFYSKENNYLITFGIWHPPRI